MEKNNISALEEQFIQECKLINLNYEYPGYTGEEKWAIISDLTEEDIMRKYAELIQPYSPFLLLNSSFGEIRKNYIRNEKKHQMRAIRSIHIFDVDEEFEEHHPEVATQSYEDEYEYQVEIEKIHQAIQKLKPIQKERIIKFFFEDKSNSSGRPMEGQVITHALKKLIRENDLPDVVFHSFRHASITYKLKWNGGDVKSVQGDSGHARAEMVSNVYSHIIDEDRRFNAQRFEERFYQGNTPEADTIPPMPKFESSTELPEAVPIKSDKKDETATDTQADTELITKLLSNPETAALLKALASKL